MTANAAEFSGAELDCMPEACRPMARSLLRHLHRRFEGVGGVTPRDIEAAIGDWRREREKLYLEAIVVTRDENFNRVDVVLPFRLTSRSLGLD